MEENTVRLEEKLKELVTLGKRKKYPGDSGDQ